MQNQNQSRHVRVIFPALRASYRWLLGIVIGSSRCLFLVSCLLWLVGVVALVLVFLQSFENRSKWTPTNHKAQCPARFHKLLMSYERVTEMENDKVQHASTVPSPPKQWNRAHCNFYYHQTDIPTYSFVQFQGLLPQVPKIVRYKCEPNTIHYFAGFQNNIHFNPKSNRVAHGVEVSVSPLPYFIIILL